VVVEVAKLYVDTDIDIDIYTYQSINERLLVDIISLFMCKIGIWVDDDGLQVGLVVSVQIIFFLIDWTDLTRLI